MVRIASTCSRSFGPGDSNFTEKRRSLCPFTCEPSPRIIRPPDAFWRSHAMYCSDHRAARECDSDGSAELDTLSTCGGDSERQIRIVLCLRRPQAVVAHSLGLPRVLRNGSQIMGEHAGVELHGTPCVLVCLGLARKVEH